jgi:hypothetical protein
LVMDNPQSTALRGWATTPTAKEKSAVQRSVTALLDTLAPERVVKRGETLHSAIEQHRTPAGCVLQAEDSALSVSWFADNRSDTIGELHVNVWRGVVSRGGSSHRKPVKASIVSEKVLRPLTGSTEGCVWRADNGTEFDTPSLAAHCVALLEKQMKSGGRS